MNLDRRVQNLEQRVGPTERVDQIILVGVAPAAEPGGEPQVVSESFLWTFKPENGE